MTTSAIIGGPSRGSIRQRPLIYWTHQPSTLLRKELARRDWKISVVTSANQVRTTAGEVTGGILDLSAVSIDEMNAVAAVCASLRNVAWVALVEAQQANVPNVRTLLRDYCFDYITLPTSHQRIADAVGHAYGMECLFAPSTAPIASADQGMIGTCDAMLQLFDTVRRIARTDAPVLVSGETGTGKELTAAAIHQHSARRAGPFVAVNCGAIPPHLLQSELFGYERGAFTGASTRKIGHVESANGGTLLLDEIGDLPLESQASLLRFLQERTIHRLGGSEPVPVDVRIVSATHVDLRGAMNEGRFRADLYHRLCVLRVDQPPLRARGKDIELLARHMLERFRADARHRVRGFSTDAISALYKHDWPGNVRELINRVRRALVMAEGRLITAHDLELDHCTEVAPLSVAAIRKSIEREVIELALLRNRGRLAGTARELGISRATLYRWMEAYGIERPRSAASPAN
ncbi:sigma-54 dependent transcriptional regulator [Burkholderia pseudomallei]|uniref:sigma-54 dependent transcriptional regulator n=1 Tax=Burkholderia pseudomallei TaxID=28450 RepID=UPI00016AD55B|nr:sigma-54 dependent transcriptional regulator [Burkholderia pseudomallei]AJX80461.1 bacterial regulatory, Fis family protein [Burkholderia pseudomallei 7894]ARK40117.1 Fis family transcriptional regulator [Burkholderia pseudomallei]ARK48514.1 Fis family transcriptional regulator [Burkholderia pseudomallei]ARK54598.1 Fis family transcriptional regulator [Burkholderia pseudomallei]ARK66119.1 Fis family transcriptional regulator [Burkholderia pseudomallei]